MTRETAIKHAVASVETGEFRDRLARRVARATESQSPDHRADLTGYLEQELVADLVNLGFEWRIEVHEGWPFLIAQRIEDPAHMTVLGYGHGDVVGGMDVHWDVGLSPWTLVERDNRWYGRGTADNKGQHTINLLALQAVLRARGHLGFNAKFLFEMGEEVLSPGLHSFASARRSELSADLFLASDGPRLSADRPTIFLGSRGAMSFDMWIDARTGDYHSGNWGGLLSDPTIQIAHAIASVAGPEGRILVPEWLPKSIPASVRRILADCEIVDLSGGPAIDPDWGEPDLSLAEKLYAWSSFCVLAFEAGNPRSPVNAIPHRAWARCQLRFVVGVAEEAIMPALRRHLDERGFTQVQIAPALGQTFRATRLDPDDPWVQWCAASIARTTCQAPAILPSLGGGLPNDVFSGVLGLPTIWVPHSYPACSQHAPNEHLPIPIAREGLAIMAGLYWDLGAADTAMPRGRGEGVQIVRV
jgi:acetylornithine deacetylase/succinyl-diaminopimelate desuccinylase-like protein